MKDSTKTNLLIIVVAVIAVFVLLAGMNGLKNEPQEKIVKEIVYVPEYHNQTIYSNITELPFYTNNTYWANSTFWDNSTYWTNKTIYRTYWNNETFWANNTVEYVYWYNNTFWVNSTIENNVDNNYWTNKTIVVICGPPPCEEKPPCTASMEQALIRTTPIIPPRPPVIGFPFGKNDWRYPPDVWPVW